MSTKLKFSVCLHILLVQDTEIELNIHHSDEEREEFERAEEERREKEQQELWAKDDALQKKLEENQRRLELVRE